MSKYKKLSNDELLHAYTKRQKILIVPNIIVMVMALVTIICSICMPMFTATVHIDGDGIITLVDEYTDDSTDEEVSDIVESALKGVEFDFTISIKPLDVIDVAMNDGDAITLFADMIGDVAGIVNDVIAQVMPNLVSYFADSFYDMIADEVTSEVDIPEDIVSELKSVIDSLSNNNVAEAKTNFSSFMDSLAEEYNLDASDVAEITSAVNEIIDNSVNSDGEFEYTAFITETLNYIADNTDTDGTDYSEIQEIVDSLNETIADFDAETLLRDAIGDTIDDETNDMIVMLMFIAVIATVGLCAALWAILFLFVLFHTLSKNRRFRTWYVKLLAWIPGLLFYFVPTAAISALKVLADSELALILSAFSITFGGSGLISGLCYLILWVISIFVLFPIKHGIRASKKQLKRRGLRVKDMLKAQAAAAPAVAAVAAGAEGTAVEEGATFTNYVEGPDDTQSDGESTIEISTDSTDSTGDNNK